MKLLLLCLLFGVAVAQTTYEPIGDEQVNGPDDTDIAATDEAETSPERAKRSCCNPGSWCTGTRGSSQYVYIPTARNWAHAQVHCVALGGSLAVVHDSATDEFLKRLAQGRRAWIGLSDAQYNNVWLWSNSDPLRFTKFCRGEPNNKGGNEGCTEINFSSAKCWNDEKCENRRPFICQKK
ncbi:unnamed protein product [Knipowitschia caucasica]|uniref:C-type lectin domain-containing protein n=1 Tax=Knipowitschia caucasica TaxID=637954 RepID=A0AAV2KQ23_KNICA